MVRSCPIVPPDKQMTTKHSHVDAGQPSHHTLWNKAPENSHPKISSTAQLASSKTNLPSTMGDAAEPPAVTHFGRDNLNASGPVIDLVAEDDLPPPTDALKSDDDWVYPFPTDFKIQEHPIDEIRPLKVGIFGDSLMMNFADESRWQ
jgi:hypothetical protein